MVLGSAAVSVLAFSLSTVSMASRPGAQHAESMNFEPLVQYAVPQVGPANGTDVGYQDCLYVAAADSEAARPISVDRSYDSMFVAPGFDAIWAASHAGWQVFESLGGDGADGVVVPSKFAAKFGVSVGDVVRIQPQQLDAAVFRGRNRPGGAGRASVLHRAAPGRRRRRCERRQLQHGVGGRGRRGASFDLVSILVGIAVVLYLLAWLNMFDNRRAIALLDQLGYRPRETSSLVVNVYAIFILAGAMLDAVLSPALLTFFGGLVSDASGYHLVLAIFRPALVVLVVLVAGFAELAYLLVLP